MGNNTRTIDFARPIFGQEEKDAVNRVMEQHWLASGKENEAFEKEFAEYIGAEHAVCVNSGSSANLLALAALELPPGSKVLTAAAGFPATLAPIIHLGYKPVFVDYDLNTQNIDTEQVLAKLPDVDAVLFAHTMGIPVDMGDMMDRAYDLDIPVIQDCCEALGATYAQAQVGAWDTGTYSFYPSHQITALGGGGMVTTNSARRAQVLRSLRDWGKIYNWDTKLGENGVRYDVMVDGMPYFAHYAYQTIGYNMKLPEANAAFGREQLKRLDEFVDERAAGWELLDELIDHEPFIQTEIPTSAEPSYFGYTLVLKEPGRRDRFSELLAARGIRHRPFFAGNVTRHPPFSKYKKAYPVADKLMADALFVGCWPGLTRDDIEYMAENINHCAWMCKNEN